MTRLLTCLLVLAVSTGGCDSSEMGDPDRVALMRIRLQNTADPSDSATITASDPDGDGQFDFSGDALTLRRESLYDGTVELLETEGGNDLVVAIRADPELYLFDYFARADNGVNFAAFVFDRERDYQPDGREIWGVGLRFRVNVASSASGSGSLLTMLRRYEPGTKTEFLSETTVDIRLPTYPVTLVAPGVSALPIGS